MWWAGAETVDLYLGGRGWWISDPHLASAQRGAPAAGESADDASAASWSTSLDAALAARAAGPRRRTAWRVWLGGDLARPFLEPPLPRGTSAVERDAVLQSLARQAFQGDRTCRVWIGRGGPAPELPGVLGVAVLADVAAEIEEGFAERRMRLSRLAPWWSAVFDACLADAGGGALGRPPARTGGCTVAVLDGSTLTMLAGAAGAAGRFDRVRSLSGVATLGDAQALWSRALASADLSPASSPLLVLRPPGTARDGGEACLPPGFTVPFSAWTYRCPV